MITRKIPSTLSLVDERCLPDEAWEMLSGIMQEGVRQYTIRMMRKWEDNHHCSSGYFDKRIAEIKARSKEAGSLMAEAKKQGFEVELKVSVEVRIAKKAYSNLDEPDFVNN